MHDLIKIMAENYNTNTRIITIENYEFENITFSNIRDLLLEDDNFKQIYTPPDECFNTRYPDYKGPVILFKYCKFYMAGERLCTISNFMFYLCEFFVYSVSNSKIEHCNFDTCRFSNVTIADSTVTNCIINYCYSIKMNNVDLIGTRINNSNIRVFKCKNIALQQIVPETGSFIGWKQVNVYKSNENTEYIIKGIAKLYIPANAKRISSGRKCRCSKAKVLKIYNPHTGESFNTALSMYKDNFEYKVGEYVYADDFDEECNECSNGIHFFLSEREAMTY
jgi:uncharacterized protein YjbI with pentapeptide repeats